MDGVLIKSINCPPDLLPQSHWYNIGGGWVATGYTYEQFYGDLDELRLHNRALSDTEIQYLKNH